MKEPTGFKNDKVTLEEFVNFVHEKSKETGINYSFRIETRGGVCRMEVRPNKICKTSTWYRIRNKKVSNGAEEFDKDNWFVWIDLSWRD